jgi:hypothetical protein
MGFIKKNKTIRDAVKALVAPAVGSLAKVHSFKKVTLGGEAVVCVFFDEAEVQHVVCGGIVEAQLTIEVMVSDARDIDDKLDAIGQKIDEAMAEDPRLGGEVSRCRLLSWSYERNTDSPYTSLLLGYGVRV